jgi:hypothetical protein
LVCTATNSWGIFYDGHFINHAANLTMTTLSTAPAPDGIDRTNGYEVMYMNGSGPNAFSARWCTTGCVPGSTPYTKYMVFRPFVNSDYAAYRFWAAGWMDSTGKMVALECGSGIGIAAGDWCRVDYVAADGTIQSTPVSARSIGPEAGYGRDTVVALNDDGTHLTFGFTNNGTDFTAIAQLGRGDWLSGPSRLWYGMYNTAAGPIATTFVGIY